MDQQLNVLIDQREKRPFAFNAFPCMATTTHLPTGDYSVAGLEDRIAIERKSKTDLYSTVGQHRARFVRELVRLDALPCAVVVVESPLDECIFDPPARSKLNPKSLWASIIAWQVRYRVAWHFCRDREFAQLLTFRLLERAYKDFHKDLLNHARHRS